MNYRFHRAALAEHLDQVAFYESRQPGLGADHLAEFDGLMSRALPLVIISTLCGIGSLLLLVRENHRGARLLAIGAVATVVGAWGVAQWPYILPTSLKVSEAAAPDATLTTILIVFALAVVLTLPSLAFLYALDQKSLLSSDTETESSPQLAQP